MAKKKVDPVAVQNPVVLTVIDDIVDTRMARMNETYMAVFMSNQEKVYRRFFRTMEEFRAYATMSKQSRSRSRLLAYYQRSADVSEEE
jgi:hypothetical protein